MQKYVIVKFLDDVADETEFDAKNWPLHVTLASNFIIDRQATHLFEKLTELSENEKPIVTTASNDDFFGPQKQVHVTTLLMTAELQSLHDHIIQLLKKLGAIFDEPHYQENGYRAHVTVQKNKRLHEGDIITIDGFTVVDMFPHNDISRRRSMKTFQL